MKLYYGVVENNWDPEMLARVQVRIVGMHTDNRTDDTQSDYMPVEDLPWAQVMQTGSSISNQGNVAIPINGSVVIISFMDAEEQIPVILGSVPKLPEALPDFTKGFSDPLGVNPTEESIGVSPISNYATGVPPPDGVINKANDVETGVICVDDTWSEPVTPFAPIYPNNLVIQQGQQVFELDATPFAERINFQHITGSFMEMHPTGDRVSKSKGDDVLVVEGDRNILVKGGSHITIRGFTSGHNVEATRDIKFKSVTGSFKANAFTDAEIEAEGITSLKGTLAISVDTDGILTIDAATAFIDITGICVISASLITLN